MICFTSFVKTPPINPRISLSQASIFESLGDVMSSAILAVTQPLGAKAMTND